MEKQEFHKRATYMDLNVFHPPNPPTKKDAIHPSYID